MELVRPLTAYPLRTVAGINTEAGYVRALEGTDLPFFETYFLGGDNSVRGFRFRSIWVRDENGVTIPDEFETPRGGDKYFQLNLEYQFLLGCFRAHHSERIRQGRGSLCGDAVTLRSRRSSRSATSRRRK